MSRNSKSRREAKKRELAKKRGKALPVSQNFNWPKMSPGQQVIVDLGDGLFSSGDSEDYGLGQMASHSLMAGHPVKVIADDKPTPAFYSGMDDTLAQSGLSRADFRDVLCFARTDDELKSGIASSDKRTSRDKEPLSVFDIKKWLNDHPDGFVVTSDKIAASEGHNRVVSWDNYRNVFWVANKSGPIRNLVIYGAPCGFFWERSDPDYQKTIHNALMDCQIEYEADRRFILSLGVSSDEWPEWRGETVFSEEWDIPVPAVQRAREWLLDKLSSTIQRAINCAYGDDPRTAPASLQVELYGCHIPLRNSNDVETRGSSPYLSRHK